MKRLLGFAIVLLCALPAGAEPAAPVYELRIYTTNPGKMPDLLARFRNHTCTIFTRLGMTNVGYWLSLDPTEGNKLYYVLAHKSREAAQAAWQAFNADPEWQQVRQASEAHGPLLSGVESVFLTTADYSPDGRVPAGRGFVYELRTYVANEGKLAGLDARFRDHTLGLFARHGMTNVLYWHPADVEKGAGHTLIYLLAHASTAAAAKSWADFRADPEWVKVRTESEKDGALLTGSPQSVFLIPTDFSPLK
jgi:CubicO group peptidase (beta-lactamase class C family)